MASLVPRRSPLAIPRQWWGYEPSGMIGVTIAAWSRVDAIFPVEAAAVWIFAPFASIGKPQNQGADTFHCWGCGQFGERRGNEIDAQGAIVD